MFTFFSSRCAVFSINFSELNWGTEKSKSAQSRRAIMFCKPLQVILKWDAWLVRVESLSFCTQLYIMLNHFKFHNLDFFGNVLKMFELEMLTLGTTTVHYRYWSGSECYFMFYHYYFIFPFCFLCTFWYTLLLLYIWSVSSASFYFHLLGTDITILHYHVSIHRGRNLFLRHNIKIKAQWWLAFTEDVWVC